MHHGMKTDLLNALVANVHVCITFALEKDKRLSAVAGVLAMCHKQNATVAQRSASDSRGSILAQQ